MEMYCITNYSNIHVYSILSLQAIRHWCNLVSDIFQFDGIPTFICLSLSYEELFLCSDERSKGDLTHNVMQTQYGTSDR